LRFRRIGFGQGRSSGRTQRHRLDRGGNRQLNAALYRIAITQSRYHPDARAYLERKKAEGKSRREAIRGPKRLLARVAFNTLKTSPRLDIGATLAQASVSARSPVKTGSATWTSLHLTIHRSIDYAGWR